MKYLPVTLLENDKKHGVSGNSESCPIARAIRRVVDSNKKISVGTTRVNIGVHECPLPLAASNFISQFDGNLNPKPISFKLPISDTLAAEIGLK